ncbi:MAG: hypothetical protein HC893_00320 [Chloroflexaceae bacterium]|nr:hypothetical protein [Chloroflexaceae bacterium]
MPAGCFAVLVGAALADAVGGVGGVAGVARNEGGAVLGNLDDLNGRVEEEVVGFVDGLKPARTAGGLRAGVVHDLHQSVQVYALYP